MARGLNVLTVREVAALKLPGRHADGGGLYLRITPAGARSWVFMAVRNGKRAEIGLGAANAVPLTTVRSLAGKMREAIAIGTDPRHVLQPESEVSTAPVSFGEFADEYVTSIKAGWKNDVHRQQWRQSLRDHAAPLRDKPIAGIGTEDVLSGKRPVSGSAQACR